MPGAATSLMRGAAVAGDLFGSLGVRPAAGRVFGGFETGVGVAEPIAVLSDSSPSSFIVQSLRTQIIGSTFTAARAGR